MDENIIAERVRELFIYNPDTGIFIRKVRLAQRHKVGDRADFAVTGGNMKGYFRISFDNNRYLAHRIAWLYVYGKWPIYDIDHINGDKSDNRISNLRDVPNSINLQNLRRCKKNNKSGLLGATMHIKDKKWRASVNLDGKKYHIGLYDNPQDAHNAYIEAKRKLHKGCTI